MKPLFLSLTVLFFVGLTTVVCKARDAAANPTPSTREEQESMLSEAQRANLNAQTAYYQAQTAKLNEPTKTKSFLTSIQENPASVLGVSAAFVAFISFIFNYRATLISQENTEFYEALQRFGDKDSVALRASSAGIMGHMAGLRRHKSWIRGLFFKAELGELPFFTTARNQLTFGFITEESEVGILSIRDSLRQLLKIDSPQTTERLYRISERLVAELAAYLTDYYVSLGVTKREEITEAHAKKAAALGFSVPLLRRISVMRRPDFDNSFIYKSLIFGSLSPEKQVEAQTTAQKQLRLTAFRLGMLVRLFHDAFSHHLAEVSKMERAVPFFCGGNFEGYKFRGFNFKGALLESANLKNADLTEAQLEGAWLHKALLDGAKMWQARIDERTDLTGCEWWKANFFDEHRTHADSRLVLAIAAKFPIPTDADAIHPSVQEAFVEAKQVADADKSE